MRPRDHPAVTYDASRSPRSIRTRATAFILGVGASLVLLLVAAVTLVDVEPDWSDGWELEGDPSTAS